jgi:hypothetical protein
MRTREQLPAAGVRPSAAMLPATSQQQQRAMPRPVDGLLLLEGACL